MMATVQRIDATMPDLHGMRAIVTGGSSGIGQAIVQALAAQGAQVVAASRHPRPVPGAITAVLDLADLDSVRRFAAAAVADGPIDLLVNNAGVMAIPHRQVTPDGFERQLATNHLGHFALTGLLLPALLAAPRARVVSVSSLAHRRGEIRFSDLQLEHGYTPWRAYAQSKLANLLFAHELQRRLRRSGATAISLAAHPGISATGIAATPMMGANRLASAVVAAGFRLVGQSASRGAQPILLAATSPAMLGGEYLGPSGLREMRGPPAPAWIAANGRDGAAAAELWRVSAVLTGVDYLGGV